VSAFFSAWSARPSALIFLWEALRFSARIFVFNSVAARCDCSRRWWWYRSREGEVVGLALSTFRFIEFRQKGQARIWWPQNLRIRLILNHQSISQLQAEVEVQSKARGLNSVFNRPSCSHVESCAIKFKSQRPILKQALKYKARH
jgi:hypothetical protein